ncbi:MAG TPA: hypothetical protein DIW64_01710 [Cellvibrio sp.]|nr:hypothetical protein [Cellvibrio sp.]
MNSKIIGESTCNLIIVMSATNTFSHTGRQVDNRANDTPLIRQRCQTNRKMRRQKKTSTVVNIYEKKL